jgi:hypothetical protein
MVTDTDRSKENTNPFYTKDAKITKKANAELRTLILAFFALRASGGTQRIAMHGARGGTRTPMRLSTGF